MTDQVSIWRWAVTDDLDDLFAQLVAADDAGFQAIGKGIMLDGEQDAPMPSLDQMEADTEAKMRASGLPNDILETMLKGLKSMMAEAREEEEAFGDEDEEDDFTPDPQGRIGVALASSHMFYDDPYVSLEYDERERQVGALMEAYRAAASKALGQGGQSFMSYLGVGPDQFYEDPRFDDLLEDGFHAVEWVWVTPQHVYALSQWHEDKELPVDLDFSRAPVSVFEALKARI